MIAFLTLLLFLLSTLSHADIHAVLMAGSAGYINYRHHADTCHAFHLLNYSGVQNIITMFYDNVAQDPQNPFPGKLFNHPSNSSHPGSDVYQGVQKDYVGNNVNAANFLAVLTGNISAVPKGHPVLTSGPNDRVFIAYFDHGGTNILGTPIGPYITRKALLNAFNIMYHKKMYKELVVYVEACESGSMFINMPTNRNIYVVTAANPTQPSYGDYCPPNNDVVYFNEKSAHIGSCLGDTFSNMWMQNLHTFFHTNETLLSQFQHVRNATQTSNVSRYGDFLFDDDSIQEFERRRLTNQVNCPNLLFK